MYLVALILIYIYEIWHSYKKMRSFFAPPVLFTLGFLVCAIVASNYYNEWDLASVTIPTYVVLSIGVIIFNRTTILLINKKNYNTIENIYLKTPSRLIICFWLLFQIVYYYLYAKAMMSVTFSSDMSEAAYNFAHSKHSDDVEYNLPGYLGTLLFYIDSLTYFLYYYFSIEIFNKKRKKLVFLLLSTSVAISIIGPLLSGSRGHSVIKLISLLFIVYYLYASRRGGTDNVHLPRRIKIYLISSFVVLASAWSAIGALVGRESDNDANYVFAVYCGAEIKNLDLYIQENNLGTSEEFGHETFIGYYTYIHKSQNTKNQTREKLDLPFRRIGNLPLGNVYTCFYMFLYDFGYKGVPIIVILMGILSGLIWNRMWKPGIIGLICVFLYSIISYDLLLSFFSNKFFESLATTKMLRIVIFWLVVLWFMKSNGWIYRISNYNIDNNEI